MLPSEIMVTLLVSSRIANVVAVLIILSVVIIVMARDRAVPLLKPTFNGN